MGTHEKLMEIEGGRYAHLYRLQSEGYARFNTDKPEKDQWTFYSLKEYIRPFLHPRSIVFATISHLTNLKEGSRFRSTVGIAANRALHTYMNAANLTLIPLSGDLLVAVSLLYYHSTWIGWQIWIDRRVKKVEGRAVVPGRINADTDAETHNWGGEVFHNCVLTKDQIARS